MHSRGAVGRSIDVSDREELPLKVKSRDIMCQSMINFKPKIGPAIEVFKL